MKVNVTGTLFGSIRPSSSKFCVGLAGLYILAVELTCFRSVVEHLESRTEPHYRELYQISESQLAHKMTLYRLRVFWSVL